MPGDALCRLLGARQGRPADPPTFHPGEVLFLRLFAGMLLVGWWALALAEAGLFGAGGVLAGVGVFSATCYALVWRLGGSRAFALPPRARPTLGGAALAAILLLTGWLAFARPFETIVGAEDAGVYFSSGGLIAREGGIRVGDPGLAEFGDAAANAAGEGAARDVLLPPPGPQSGPNDRFIFLDWQRLSGFNLVPGDPNTVTPQFLHLFPTWLALWATFGGGVGAMVYGGAAFGLLGVAATALLARRLFGAGAGLLAGLLLTLNGLQIWFARQSLSETLLQPLLVGGLLAWATFVSARDAGDKATARIAALIAGLALGSVALTHAQFIFALLPVAALGAWLWLARRWRGVYWWFFAPLLALLAHAAFHIARYSLGYFEGIYHHVWRNAVRDWEQTTLMLLGPLALIALLGVRPLRDRWLPLVTDARTLRAARWLGAAGVVLGAAWLYLVRPGIIGAGGFGGWQGYIGAPVPPGAASAIVSLGWYLSPLGMALAGGGLLLLIVRDFEERAAAPLCVAAPFAVLYLTGTYTAGGYIYSLRRFVPLIVPLAAILAAYCALRLGPALAASLRRPALARPLQGLGLGAAALLVIFLVYTNARLITHREYAGALDATRALADRFGPDDILLFSGPRDETLKLATPLRYLFGRESWVITTNLPDGKELDAWIARQEATGRRVHVLLSAGGGKLFLPAHRLEPVGRVELPLIQVETLENQKPFNQQINRLGYTLYTLRPVAPGGSALGPLPYRVTAGEADEFAQLSLAGQTPGFYNVERDRAIGAGGGGADTSYRWTDGEALLRIPWPADGRPLTLRLTLGAGPRPASLPPAQVVVGIRPDPGSIEQERQLTVLALTPDYAEYTVTIPADALGPTADGTAIIRLGVPRTFDGKAWQPAPGGVWRPVKFPEATNNSTDPRELHLRFVRAELTAGP